MSQIKPKNLFAINKGTENNEGNMLNTELKNSNEMPKLSFEETANKIATINKNNLSNFLEIGDLLLSFEENNGKTERNRLIKDKRVCIRRTQAEKIIRASKYRRQKIKSCQPTDVIEKLGIEKIDCISKLDDTNRRTELENFVIENDISVKKLRQTVKVINQDDTIDVETACKQAEQIIAEAKEQKKIAQTDNYWKIKYDEMTAKYEEEINKMKSKIEELSKQNQEVTELTEIDTNGNLSETIVQEQTESLSRESNDNNSDDSVNVADNEKTVTRDDKIKEFA